MSNEDDIFWRRFGAILAGLVIFGFVVAFLARSIANDSHQATMNMPMAVAKRIEPVGDARIGDPSKVVAPVASMTSAPAAAATSAVVDGEATYNTACMACHASGAAGAPKKGDDAAWKARIALGEDALVKSVIQGKGAMPAKAGNPGLTEAQIRAAVQYLTGQGGDAAAPGAVEAVKQAAEEVAEKATDMAKEAVSDVTSKATAVANEATDAAKQVASKATEAASTAVAAVTAAAPAPAANDGKPGVDVYNMGCVACHTTGVANAPKINDKAAWDARLTAGGGFDGVLKAAIAGKGAMPPKGGLPISEADLANAIHYILKQAGAE